MSKSKLQFKIWQATLKRKQERLDNNRRAAWNRVGKRFRLSKEELDSAKKSGLNPYRLLRDESVTTESARAYIQYGNMQRPRYDSWADYSVEMEIARLEHLDDIFDE
jgi:hypothetical protein